MPVSRVSFTRMWFIDTSLSEWLKHNRHQDLQTAHQVPKLFREPYIQFGYRRPHQPLIYYFKSVFGLHNETFNVWTHVIGCIIIFMKFIHYYQHFDSTDEFSQIFCLFCFASCVYLLTSVFAHLLQSHSDLSHYVSFYFDYMGISIYCLCAGIGCFYLASEPEFVNYLRAFYLPLIWTFAYLTGSCCIYAKYRFQRPYPPMRKVWQMAPAGSVFITATAPILTQRLPISLMQWSIDGAEKMHAFHVCLFAIATFFFSVHYPQKWSPGTFDILGNSHQLFHIFMFGSTSCLMDALFLDLKSRRIIYSSYHQPNIVHIYGYIIALIVADVITIWVFRNLTKHKIQQEKEH